MVFHQCIGECMLRGYSMDYRRMWYSFFDSYAKFCREWAYLLIHGCVECVQ